MDENTQVKLEKRAKGVYLTMQFLSVCMQEYISFVSYVSFVLLPFPESGV